MRIALCQIDTFVGDLDGNVARIVDHAVRSRAGGAELAVFPELAISGYPPEDLLLRAEFLAAHDRALQAAAAAVPADLPVLVGCVARNAAAATAGGRPLHNAVALLSGGKATIVARKSLLPTYDVFDEGRYFEPWRTPEHNVVAIAGKRIGIVVCEDGWNDAQFFPSRQYPLDPVECVVRAGAELVVNLSASPWQVGKEAFRVRMISAAAKRHGVPMLYVNLVGGNVELQFDGGSIAAGPEGLAFVPIQFAETLQIVDTAVPWREQSRQLPLPERHWRAIVQGIRDCLATIGARRAVVGLSGGIDSALVATLAVDALGADNVTGLALPSHYSSDHSVADARALANNLAIEFRVVPVGPLQDASDAVLAPLSSGPGAALARENLQARLRAVVLMAFSNTHGHLLLTTGNKSECAVGYCTMYGDTCGALAPIADLWKTEVWELARFLNRDGVRIPVRSIDKAPSAELRPGQLDTDNLPPYPQLDPVLRCLVEEELSVEATAERTGMPRPLVADLFARVQAAEWKRYQYPPAIRVSERCWSGRRMPVVHRYVER